MNCLSMYNIINTIPHGKCFVLIVFVSEIEQTLSMKYSTYVYV